MDESLSVDKIGSTTLSGAEIPDVSDSRFSPSGDYEVSVKFNEEHIPDSPFQVAVTPSCEDARRLTIASLQVMHGEGPVS